MFLINKLLPVANDNHIALCHLVISLTRTKWIHKSYLELYLMHHLNDAFDKYSFKMNIK